MKKIICLWGGPGTGKSTTCAGVFNLLKKEGYNAEMNREYVKDWVWENRQIKSGDQPYLFAKAARKERLYMMQGLDFIVTDSPLALMTFYGYKYDKYEKEFDACRYMLKQHHAFCKDSGYKIDHFFLQRTKEYNPSGRLQTENEARQYDLDILQFLESFPINYKTLVCDADVEKRIVEEVLESTLNLDGN